MERRIGGFTLVELLLVIVIVGILAAFVVPRFEKVRNRSLLAAMESDLRTLSIQQELYYHEHGGYAGDPALLDDFEQSKGVDLKINWVAPVGWAATAVLRDMPNLKCGIFVGDAPPAEGAPATAPGKVECTQQ